MMPFEWIWDTSLSALLAALILWATLELAESEKWLDWGVYGVVVGLGADDESGAGLAAAVFAGVGGVSRTRGKRNALEARGAGGWCSDSVLLAVDRFAITLRFIGSFRCGRICRLNCG